MANTPITLAALATSAVSGLQVTGYRALRLDDSVEHSVILESSEGDLLVQLPTSPSAEVHHSAKILGQSALTPGVREQLPFEAPRVLGMTRSNETRAIVSTYLNGDHFSVEDLAEDSLALASIAVTLATIHDLPRSVVIQQGLRVRGTNDSRLDAKTIVDRARQSGLVPETVRKHWESQLSNQQLWDFQPTVIHGSLSDATLLLTDDTVTGVLDWAEFSIGDPAADFAWLGGAGSDVLKRVAELYAEQQSHNSVRGIIDRALFWHEIEIAEWLLHGIENREQSIIDDAVELFDQLVSQIVATPESTSTPSNLASAEAAIKPDSVPDSFSDTASYDLLDEDRDFGNDRDFLTEPVEPLLDEDDVEASASEDEGQGVDADDSDENATVPVELTDLEAPEDQEK